MKRSLIGKTPQKREVLLKIVGSAKETLGNRKESPTFEEELKKETVSIYG